jgi:hypothetical protein
MTRPLLLLAGIALALACGNDRKIPLGSLDGAVGPSPDRGDAALPDVPRSIDSSPAPPAPGPIDPGPVVPDASSGVPVPGPVFPDAGAAPAPIGGDGGCGVTSLCWSLRVAYARSLDQARSCNPMKGDPCSVKVVDSLGCSKCETFVNDDTTLAMLRQQFQLANCQRCFFIARPDPSGAPQPASGCPNIVCGQLNGPTCSPTAGPGAVGADASRGQCDSSPLATCPAGLMNGSACSGQFQYCFGGGFAACQCAATEPPTWQCF